MYPSPQVLQVVAAYIYSFKAGVARPSVHAKHVVSVVPVKQAAHIVLHAVHDAMVAPDQY